VTFELPCGDYLVSDDPARLDRGLIHRWLSESSYWAGGRTRETVDRSLDHGSIGFGVYAPDGAMVGFARVVTDHATFGWLCDVFVIEEHRGRGLGKALMQAAVTHPDLRHLKRYLLATADAQGFYAQFGFEALDNPERWMMRRGETA
jgi:GNAT superfamily N-acetyltransferase